MCALTHPSVRVVAIMDDDDRATVLKYSAEGIAENLQIADSIANLPALDGENYMVCLLEPTEEVRKAYSNCKTTEIL